MKFRSFIYMPYSKDLNSNVKQLRNHMTDEESKLWYQYLRSYPVRFTRQKPVGFFILDFYCAKYKLGIELDGSQHATEQGLAHDEERSRILAAFSINILRFTNDQVRNEFSAVCRQIDQQVQRLMAK